MNLAKTQTLYIYKMVKTDLIDKDKDFVLAIF